MLVHRHRVITERIGLELPDKGWILSTLDADSYPVRTRRYRRLACSNTMLLVFHASSLSRNIKASGFMWHAVQSTLRNFSRFVWNQKWGSGEIHPSRPRGSVPVVTILCLLGEDQDRSLITDLCQHNPWEVFFATTRQEAEQVSQTLKPQIIFFDRDMAGQDWRSFVTGFAAASGRACIMLVSKVIDDYLWNELVSNGGYEVLRKPLREDQVSRAVRMAWSYWSSAAKRVSSSKR